MWEYGNADQNLSASVGEGHVSAVTIASSAEDENLQEGTMATMPTVDTRLVNMLTPGA